MRENEVMSAVFVRVAGIIAAVAGGVAIGNIISRRSDAMYNFDRELRAFYRECVRLSGAVQGQLRRNRDANRHRIEMVLRERGGPLPLRFIIQGSYAMDTIIQSPNNEYDIDDGVVFASDELVGPRGGKLSPRQVRRMVCEALRDPRFSRQPEMRKNCVRVYYNEGHHVDIPVYRIRKGFFGDIYLDIASADDWKRAHPEAVTDWYNKAVVAKSPDGDDGRQMRRITRLLKAFAKSRVSWNMPSGFVISKLVHDEYVPDAERDDVALYKTMIAIHRRLRHDLEVEHPVLSEMLTETYEDACMVEFRHRLGEAQNKLSVLFANDCSERGAARAWDSVYGTSYFSDRLFN